MTAQKVNVAILGASGYTGAELIRLLAVHPNVRLTALTADRKAGQKISEVFPHLSIYDLPTLIKIDDLDVDSVDLIFCALPHATTQDVIAKIPREKLVIDLSADFRLRDTTLYSEVYGGTHKAPDLQPEAVYGLSEIYRDQIKETNLIACPGCYPTSAELPLIPLLKAKAIDPTRIIIDSKSGVTGAGRAPKEGTLFSEVADGFHAYGVGTHRHAPEIEQELTAALGADIAVTFTPHLLPINRGILSTIHVTTEPGQTAENIHKTLVDAYDEEPFVHVLPYGQHPTTRQVRGTNHCKIGVVADRVPGRVIIISVIDNLVKGASGQAIQNMNIRMGWPETLGLEAGPLFP